MHATTPAPQRLTGNFVLLKADALHLLLPQEDLGAAEYLEGTPRASSQPGWFEIDGQGDRAPRLVAALSAAMEPLPALPAGRFLLTGLAAQDGVALCWNEVKVLIDVELETHELPPVLLPPDAPLRRFVEFDDGPAFCCSGQGLLAYAFAQRM